MNKEQQIKKAKSFLSEGKLKKCLEILKTICPNRNGLVQTLSIQLNTAEEEKFNFLIADDDYNVQIARIVMRITTIIEECEEKNKIIVYFVGYSTPNLAQLRINDEFNNIQDTLKDSKYFKLYETIITNLEELNILIGANNNFFVIHFACHGEIEGLHLGNGSDIFINNSTILTFLRPFQERIKCIILNACNSNILGEQLVQFINNVIFMKKPVRDNSSITYSRYFYHYLSNNYNSNNSLIFKQSHNYAYNTFGLSNNPDIYTVDFESRINL